MKRGMSKSKITKQDLKVLDFIKSYIAQYGYPPSYREIGEGVNMYSNATVYYHIQKLIKFGEIETDHPGAPRAIRLKKEARMTETADV